MNSIKHLECHQCRVCYDSKLNLQLLTTVVAPRTNQTDEKTYAQLLLEVCDINVMDDKPLGRWPLHICHNCSYKLKLAYDFISQTHKVNRLLKSIADLLDNRSKTDYFELPELDIPLEIKIDPSDTVDVLPNEMVFQYSPVQMESDTEFVKTELSTEVTANLEYITVSGSKDNKTSTVTCYSEYSAAFDLSSACEDIKDDSTSFNDDDDNSSVFQVNNIESTKVNSSRGFACSICNKTFCNNKQLGRHVRYTHRPEEKQYPCPVCLFKFKRSDNLKRHMQRIHKPKKSQKKNELKISKSVTTSTRKTNSAAKKINSTFPCNICKKTFNSCTKLSCSHSKTEKNLRKTYDSVYEKQVKSSPQKNLVEVKGIRFFCDECDRSYTRRCRLSEHKRKFHA